MRTIKNMLRTAVFYIVSLVLTVGYPMTALAEDPPTSSNQTPTPTYTYDQGTHHWDTDKWHYNGTTGTYQQAPPSAPAPTPADTTSTASTSNADPSSQATSPIAPQSATDGSTASAQSSNTDTTSANTAATVNNSLQSTATSGGATVAHNTTGGNATSGNAAAEATIVNTVHSSVQGDNGGIAHFVADINGNVNGDITLYPAIANASVTHDGSLNVNDTATLNNNVTLSATSGDATMAGNTTGGNATSGTADTVANVVNLINSIIAANKSFIGTINIHGNLNGDILISPDFIPQLLASNAPSSNSTATSTMNNQLTANLTNNQTVINNIQLAANTGNATVAGNTTGGSATTGAGQTNLTVLNLTGQQVIAKDSILVFVNVLGTWVGVIAGAPVGTTAAVLGNGVTSDTIVNNQTINAVNSSQITNNINLVSTSGNATVANNTTGGNATSGNATASANIANIDMSSFKLSDWFGIVFINVFGKWYGDFAMDSQSGNMVQIAAPEAAAASQSPVVQFGFIPHATAPPALALASSSIDASQATPLQQAEATLAAAKVEPNSQAHTADMPELHMYPPKHSHATSSLPLIVTLSIMGGVPLLAILVLVRRWLGLV
jgi:hypothetical protein